MYHGSIIQPLIVLKFFGLYFIQGLKDQYQHLIENENDFLIPVEDGLFIDARLHKFDKAAPVILFFHGNGEDHTAIHRTSIHWMRHLPAPVVSKTQKTA